MATSRIVLFDIHYNYLGDYHLTMIDELPIEIVEDKLVFNYTVNEVGTHPHQFTIDFTNGIPAKIFLFESLSSGSEYQFSKNL